MESKGSFLQGEPVRFHSVLGKTMVPQVRDNLVISTQVPSISLDGRVCVSLKTGRGGNPNDQRVLPFRATLKYSLSFWGGLQQVPTCHCFFPKHCYCLQLAGSSWVFAGMRCRAMQFKNTGCKRALRLDNRLDGFAR